MNTKRKKKTPHVTFTVEGLYCIFPGFCKSKQLREGLFFLMIINLSLRDKHFILLKNK